MDKNQDPGAGINIPDSQHWRLHMIKETLAVPLCVTDEHAKHCLWSGCAL